MCLTVARQILGYPTSAITRPPAVERGDTRRIDAASGGGEANQLRLGGEAASGPRGGAAAPWPLRRCEILQWALSCPVVVYRTVGQDSSRRTAPNRPVQGCERAI